MFKKSIDTGSITVEISILNTKVKWKRKGFKTFLPMSNIIYCWLHTWFPLCVYAGKHTLGGIVYSECTTTLWLDIQKQKAIQDTIMNSVMSQNKALIIIQY